MRSPRRHLLIMLLAGTSNLSCLADYPDTVHNCDVTSPNDTWARNNVVMEVTYPVCPVQIGYSGQSTYFNSATTAPSGMPGGPFLYTDAFDAMGGLLSTFTALWVYDGSSRARAQGGGYYAAGSVGFPMGVPVIQDVARAVFAVTSQYGSQAATGYALLPYKLTAPAVPSQKVVASQWTQPKVGNTSFLRVVPQIPDNIQRSYLWSFDGKLVIDTAASGDPRYPIAWNKQTFKAKVWTRGIHLWKVDMRYGSWPSEQTVTITWNQTWN
jgi:hypothetical protein